MAPRPPTVGVARFDRPIAVLGDIHGRVDLLDDLLRQLGDRPLVVVGDVCDRGPDTRQVLDRLIERSAIGVRGNHDEWLIAWATGKGFDDFALKPVMGGLATLRSYGVEGVRPREVEAQAWRVPRAHRDWLASLPLVLDLWVMGTPFWVIHAGIAKASYPAGLSTDAVVPWMVENLPGEMLWRSTQPTDSAVLDRAVIMGHVPLAQPVDLGPVIALDAGAGPLEGGNLAALLLPERTMIQSRLRFDRKSTGPDSGSRLWR